MKMPLFSPISVPAFCGLAIGAALVLAPWRAVSAAPAPPSIDKSTPRAQGGYRLVDVKLRGRNIDRWFRFPELDVPFETFPQGGLDADIGLLIQPPPDPDAKGAFDAFAGRDHTLSASAQSSTGDVFDLYWRCTSWFSDNTPWLLICVPASYPANYRFIDVSVSDQHGHSARWRLEHLAPAVHPIQPPVHIVDSVSVRGVRMSARAWREHEGDWTAVGATEMGGYVELPPPIVGQPDTLVVACQVSGKPDSGSDTWIGIGGLVSECGPAATDGCVLRFGFPSPGMDRFGNPTPAKTTILVRGRTPYAPSQKWMQCNVAVDESASLREEVIFHDVEVIGSGRDTRFVVHSTQSVTTASGISIKLFASDQPQDPPVHDGALYVACAPQAPGSYLRQSPLCKRYHRPVDIWIDPGQHTLGEESGGNGFWWVEKEPRLIKDLTFTVVQTCWLKSTPVSFTLPVADQVPSDLLRNGASPAAQ